MVVTEEEAKTMWCPFVRAPLSRVGDTMAGVNTNYDGVRLGLRTWCITTQCMAWRRGDAIKRDDEWHEGGYCGLAGKP